jgi:hypothetical protein
MFRSYWRASRGVQTLCVLTAGDGSKLGIVAADLALRGYNDAEGAFGYLGQGCAYQDIVDALSDETRQLRQQESPIAVAWAVHFPPRFVNGDATLKLLDEENLLDAATSLNVPLVFAGHTHDPRDYVADGYQVRILCAGSAMQFSLDRGNWVELVDVDVSGQEITSVIPDWFEWRDDQGAFVRTPLRP